MGDAYDAQEAYQEFAKETYGTMRGDLVDALLKAGDKSVLLVVGEGHYGSPLNDLANKVTPDKYENPPQSSVYSDLIAIQVAVDTVGKDNVLISIEAPPSKQELIENWDGNMSLEQKQGDIPLMGKVAAYAHKQGFNVSYDDPLGGIVSYMDQKRYDAEIEAVGKHGLRVDDEAPKIVVRLVGSAHLAMLQGHKVKDVYENRSSLTKDQAEDPLECAYGQRLFYNTAQPSVATWEAGLMGGGAPIDYFTNPANATQIDPLGALPEGLEIKDVAQEIQRVSAELSPAQLNEIVPPSDSEITVKP